MNYFKAFLGFLIGFVVIDSLWIGFVVRAMYGEEIPNLLSASPDLVAGVMFYLVFAATAIFLLAPAIDTGKTGKVIFTGAIFGLATYGTYSFTNMAVLKGWTYSLVVPDVLWGMFISAVCAWLGLLATRIGR